MLLALIRKLSSGFRFSKKIKNTNKINKNEPTILRKQKITNNINKKNSDDKKIWQSEEDFVFKLPSPGLLIKSNTKNSHRKELENINKHNSEKLEKILSEYGIEGSIVGYKSGPIVTLFSIFAPSI